MVKNGGTRNAYKKPACKAYGGIPLGQNNGQKEEDSRGKTLWQGMYHTLTPFVSTCDLW